MSKFYQLTRSNKITIEELIARKEYLVESYSMNSKQMPIWIKEISRCPLNSILHHNNKDQYALIG